MVFAAQKIECVGSHMDQLKLARSTDGSFILDLDEALSSKYVGEIQDRAVFPEASKTADLLSDWDGNSGVNVSFRKGFLGSAQGTKSRAFVTVLYNDIETDRVSHPLNCTVVK